MAFFAHENVKKEEMPKNLATKKASTSSERKNLLKP
jgi:hypothetical protein